MGNLPTMFGSRALPKRYPVQPIFILTLLSDLSETNLAPLSWIWPTTSHNLTTSSTIAGDANEMGRNQKTNSCCVALNIITIGTNYLCNTTKQQYSPHHQPQPTQAQSNISATINNESPKTR